MTKTRVLNEQEKCELISALSNAKQNNTKKAKAFKCDADSAHHREDVADLSATSERYNMWAQLDESFIELIRDGRIVIIEESEEE
jgi:hypothetical protein